MRKRLQRGLLLEKPSVAYPSFRFGVAAVKAADDKPRYGCCPRQTEISHYAKIWVVPR